MGITPTLRFRRRLWRRVAFCRELRQLFSGSLRFQPEMAVPAWAVCQVNKGNREQLDKLTRENNEEPWERTETPEHHYQDAQALDGRATGTNIWPALPQALFCSGCRFLG